MEGAGRKHTDAQIAERRKAIRAVLAAGRWSMAAAEQIATKFGVSIQQVADVDRRIVLQEIRDSMSPEERENSAAMWLLQVDELYATAMAKGDRANAAKALALKGKMLGLDAPVRVEHSGPDRGPVRVAVTTEDVAAGLRLLGVAVVAEDLRDDGAEDE